MCIHEFHESKRMDRNEIGTNFQESRRMKAIEI